MDETYECRYCGAEHVPRSYRPKLVCYQCYVERLSYAQMAWRHGPEGIALYRRRYFPERVLPASVWGEGAYVRAAYDEIYGDAYRELRPVYVGNRQ